ncbi:MAG: PIG-L deacetylase family protein [Sciscionella sp.]
METSEPLKPLPEDWARALVVVAHPDDMEFGAAAAVARWTGQGKEVAYCLVTSGEAGIDGMDPAHTKGVREAEQRESCRIVGVDSVEFLGQPDGVLEYGVALRRVIASAIRRHQPEVVITNNFQLAWRAGGPLNQADHIATGRAVLDAVRDAGNRWVFPEQLTGRVEPWGGVRQVWVAGSAQARHGVDTTATFEQGVDSLRAHAAYLDGLGWKYFDPLEFLEGYARPTGSRLGCAFGAAFEVFAMSWETVDD